MPYPPRSGVKAMVCVHQAGSAHRAKNASIDLLWLSGVAASGRGRGEYAS
jgi:hypothetical protein